MTRAHCFCKGYRLGDDDSATLTCCRCSYTMGAYYRPFQYYACYKDIEKALPCIDSPELIMLKALGQDNCYGAPALVSFNVVAGNHNMRAVISSRPEMRFDPVCVHDHGRHLGYCAKAVAMRFR